MIQFLLFRPSKILARFRDSRQKLRHEIPSNQIITNSNLSDQIEEKRKNSSNHKSQHTNKNEKDKFIKF